MNINAILRELGVSKFRAAFVILTKGMSGLLELLAKAFTSLLRKAPPDKLEYYAELSANIAKFIRYGLELFIKNEAYRKAGIVTANGLEAFAKHISDGEYTSEELNEDIDFIEECIKLWKETRK